MTNDVANKIADSLYTALSNITNKPKVSLENDLIDNSPYISLGNNIIIVFYDKDIGIEVIDTENNISSERQRFPITQSTDASIYAMQLYLNIEVLSLLEVSILGK